MHARRLSRPSRPYARLGGWALIGVLGLSLASPARAAEPLRVELPVDVTFAVGALSAVCGVPVTASFSGILKATVFVDPQTGLIREIDTQPGVAYTVSSATGSFSFPFSTVYRTVYVEGIAPGSRAVVRATGLASHVPGISSEAGTVLFEQARVLFVLPSGVPIVDFGAPTLVAGNPVDRGAVAAAACAVLAP